MPLDPRKIQAQLPGWVIMSRLGGGGQSEVFEASHVAGDSVALKIVDVNAVGRDRLQRELEALEGANSPHLPTIKLPTLIDLAIDGKPYAALVEELIRGDRLDSLLGTPWAEDESLLMAHDIVLALDAVNGKRLVHRDIKPNNVMKRSLPDGRYVLLDLGIARFQGRTTLTIPGGHPGTPGYRSPEQLRNRDDRQLDVRSDFFNIGLLLYHTLAGIHPVGNPNAPDHVYADRVLNGRIKSIASVRQGLGPRTIEVTTRLLKPFPNGRYRDVPTLLGQIHGAMEDIGRRRCQCF